VPFARSLSLNAHIFARKQSIPLITLKEEVSLLCACAAAAATKEERRKIKFRLIKAPLHIHEKYHFINAVVHEDAYLAYLFSTCLIYLFIYSAAHLGSENSF
jgi:hypothetical protein